MSRLLGLLILLAVSSARAGGMFVGNGGDVVRGASGKLCLSDFYEYGICERTFIGHAIHPRIQKDASKLKAVVSMGVSEELLLGKLSDMEEAHPSLGRHFLDVISIYIWRLEAQEFTALHEPTLRLAPGDERLQIAIRRNQIIRVSKPIWERLEPEHRVGLILHEVISAVLVPVPTEADEYEQVVTRTRALTARLFFSSASERRLRYWELDWLGLPFLLRNDVLANRIGISFGESGQSKKEDEKMSPLFLAHVPGLRTYYFRKACARLEAIGFDRPMIIRYKARGASTYSMYCASFGEQLRVELPAANEVTMIGYYISSAQCYRDLMDFFAGLYTQTSPKMMRFEDCPR